MSRALAAVTRFGVVALIVLFQAALFVWMTCAPLVWIVRDGLGPDSHDSVWPWSVVKFAAQWGVPALVLAVPLVALQFVERRLIAQSLVRES
jgi:hypothetical protein